jgi:hypothetical protein
MRSRAPSPDCAPAVHASLTHMTAGLSQARRGERPYGKPPCTPSLDLVHTQVVARGVYTQFPQVLVLASRHWQLVPQQTPPQHGDAATPQQ